MARLITRFAPSPTGPLHLGHAFSALTAFDLAQKAQGQFLLRIEDIDTARCQPTFEAQILDDLRWLGLEWPTPVLRQSNRAPAYVEALTHLRRLGVIYACLCTRGEIRACLSAPQEGTPMIGPDGPLYPGTCRDKNHPYDGAAIRLNMRRATELIGPVTFSDTGPLHSGPHTYTPDWLTHHVGDIVLARRDIGVSYHLAVTVDDAAQGITLVVRGEDLFEATAVHCILQRLLELPTPDYHHHRLIRDTSGKRLAKRHDALALAKIRAGGDSPIDIRARLGLGAAAKRE